MTSQPTPSSVILSAVLRYTAIATAVIGVVGGVIGYLVGGVNGLWSALAGVVLSGVFLGITALIILLAGRLNRPDQMPIFFGLVLGGWFLKLVVFVVGLLVLRVQPWLNGTVFFFCVLATVIASLVIDMVVIARARVPYVGNVALPGDSEA